MWTNNNGRTFHGQIDLSYPYLKPLIPNETCALVAVGFPILVVTLGQIKFRSWWDFYRDVVGSFKAVLFEYAL